MTEAVEVRNCARRLLSSFQLTLYPDDSDYIICGICQQIMFEACQIICGCRFCRQCMEDYLRDGRRYCPVNVTVDCGRVSLVCMDDVHEEKESNKMISSLNVHCPIVGCDVEGGFGDMIAHFIKCKTVNGDDFSLMDSERTVGTTCTTLRNEVNLLDEKVEKNMEKMANMMKVLEERLLLIDRKIGRETARINSLIKTVSDITKKINTERNDEFVWKIVNYSQKKVRGSAIVSEDFYTRKNGYKLRMMLYPNGDDQKGTHLSLYFQIMKGEYDDILSWPFKYDVTFSVLDQDGLSEHFNKTMTYSDRLNQYYQKPGTSDNQYFGLTQFMATSIFESQPYLIENDTIFIRCSVVKYDGI